MPSCSAARNSDVQTDYSTVSEVSEQSKNNMLSSEDIEEMPSEASKIRKSYKIATLGDSIPRGYGLESPVTQCFPSQIRKNLSESSSDVKLFNYAVDGMASQGLKEQLQSNGAPEIKDADIIIICIGSNNVLSNAFELIYADNLDVPQLFADYAKFLLTDKTNSAAPDALSDYFESISTKAATDEFMSKINEGVNKLKEDIPVIIGEVRKHNKSADIYFTTIYSPYDGMNLSLPYVKSTLLLGDLSDKFVTQMNKVINDLAQEYSYKIFDIYSLFKKNPGDNVNAGIDVFNLKIDFDPHPNLEGHTLIAEELTKILMEDTD